MPTGIIITAIICVTLVILCALMRVRRPQKEQEYEYHVVHANVPRGAVNAIEQGIRTALLVFPGEVVAVCNDPYYQDMSAPTYSIVIKTPKKDQKESHDDK